MSGPTTNGNGIWKKILAAALIPLALGLIGYGALQNKVQTVSDRMAEEIPRAEATHRAIEQRTDQKLLDQRELILSRLDDIVRRLDRIERKP